MLILTIRTDKPEAEIGLFSDKNEISYITWTAHRMLAETIHQKIERLFSDNNLIFNDLEGIIFYKGPGSFTGLRIGASVANALAYSYELPVVDEGGESWIQDGLKSLLGKEPGRVASIDYGDGKVTTNQKK